MDALERNHGDLSLTVARVEQNQKHAEELNKLRFDALEASVRSLGSQLSEFMKRIEGIITGEIQLPAQRDLLQEYRDRNKRVDARLDALEDARVRQSGIFVALGGAKGAVVAISAVASPVIVLLVALLKP